MADAQRVHVVGYGAVAKSLLCCLRTAAAAGRLPRISGVAFWGRGTAFQMTFQAEEQKFSLVSCRNGVLRNFLFGNFGIAMTFPRSHEHQMLHSFFSPKLIVKKLADFSDFSPNFPFT